MIQWYSKSRVSDAPNRQNRAYLTVPVDNGSTRAMRYACAGCKRQLAEADVNFVVESSNIDAALTTRYGSLYVYASGSAYPSDNRSWPYCDQCYADLTSSLLADPPALTTATANDGAYTECACAHCGDRTPTDDQTAFVLQPSKIVHRKGGPGMTAASYPRIRGKAIRTLCSPCMGEFNPGHVEDVAAESISAESVKQRYSNGELGDAELESELERELSEN